MIYNLIPLIIIAICLVIIIRIIIKKFPVLAAINLQTLPQERAKEVKERILEQKFNNQIKESHERLVRIVAPWLIRFKNLLKVIYDQVLEWEKRYQKKRLVTASNVSQSHNRLRQLLLAGKEDLQKQDFAAAESNFVEAIKLDHKNLEAYRGLGELYWQQEDLRQAKETYEFLSRLVPTEANVLEKLAVLSQKVGDLAAAEAYYLKAIANAKQNAALYFALAEVYQQVGENNLSFKTLLEAQRLEPNNAKIIDKLIEISIILKDSEAAKQFLAHLKNLNPENQKILEWEEQISQLKEA